MSILKVEGGGYDFSTRFEGEAGQEPGSYYQVEGSYLPGVGCDFTLTFYTGEIANYWNGSYEIPRHHQIRTTGDIDLEQLLESIQEAIESALQGGEPQELPQAVPAEYEL